MTHEITDIMIVGAGPVGLMCAYLGKLCDLNVIIADKSASPLEVGRADALNARTLQLLELVDLFSELYPLGKTCNTSSVFANGQFVSRQSAWWEALEGCFHRHFLMLGQSYLEKCLDKKLQNIGVNIKRSTSIEHIERNEKGCLTTLSTGQKIQSRFLIGADGASSFVRNKFNIPFEITRPQIIWAVMDGIIETDFPVAPEIIVFQADSSDVAWIPREGNIDRFYIRMDRKNFTQGEALEKIHRAIQPYRLRFKEVTWFSQFSVKESVAEKFFTENSIFIVGDACHIHSVNGGQGLNTGLADAFNLMWKLNMVIHFDAPLSLLESYETERKPVAKSVIETSGKLVRATKYAKKGEHAESYVKLVEKNAGNITGMGIRYGEEAIKGTRLFDFELFNGLKKTRIYSLLDYTKFTLLLFGKNTLKTTPPPFLNVLQLYPSKQTKHLWCQASPYYNRAVLVRPDAYIEGSVTIDDAETLLELVAIS
jgi:2-polyprenyl-6-methoxyphenol hydroxylase-like FAD-dependent oxidoreductase